jgi:hypothetical protein
MSRMLLLIGLTLLATDCACAQDSPDPTPMQCHLIKLAVAQYGYSAARQHALETYGAEAVRTGDKCFAKDMAGGAPSHVSRDFRAERNNATRYRR